MAKLAPLLIALSSLAVGCGPPDVVSVPLTFDLAVSGALGGASGGSMPGAGAEVSQSLSNNRVKSNQIDSVTVESLTLVHLSPTGCATVGCDLSFIDTLTVTASATGQPQIEVGTLSQPAAVGSAELTLTGAELKPYITAEDMTLGATLLQRERPIQDVALRLDAVLRVDVNVLGKAEGE